MTEAVKFPSARQDVFYIDPQTKRPVFTRPWFLFLQSLWERQGGAIGPSVSDLEKSLFEDAGTSETNAQIFALEQSLMQAPVQAVTHLDVLVVEQSLLQTPNPPIVPPVEELVAQVAQLRDTIAEMQKTIESIQQGISL